jgi:Rad3-related DNA helicase
MMEVIQAYGRAIRAEDDKAEFYVVDGSFQKLVRNCWPYIPDWFKEALPPTLQPPTADQSLEKIRSVVRSPSGMDSVPNE